MESAHRLTVKSLALFLFVPIMAASCATVVTFDVEHPPLVDLRDAKTITVIPFEWNSGRGNSYLASCVTAALLNGLRRGSIDTVDPYTLEQNGVRNYSQYADVYITGRVISVSAYDQVQTRNEVKKETVEHQIIIREIREIITQTAVADIEYSYIRSVDNKTLGTFKKSERTSASFEQIRYERQNTGRNQGNDTYRNTNPNSPRRGTSGRGRARGSFPQRWSWQEGLAESAIARFSDTMDQEIGLWTTTEKRKIKNKTGDEALAAEARTLIEQNRYDEAIALYKNIYEQNGNIFAGYNAAILLSANEQFSDALGFLEHLRGQLLKEDKKVPLFIKNEIKKTTELVNGFTALEAYRGEKNAH